METHRDLSCFSSRRRIAAAGISVLLIAALVAAAQADNPLDSGAVLNHLTQIVAWYRDSTTKIRSVGLPTDVIYQSNAQELSAQAVRLAFQSARAEAALMGTENKNNRGKASQTSGGAAGQSSGGASAEGAQPQNIAQVQANVTQRIAQNESQIDQLDKQMESARSSKKKDDLMAQRETLQGQVQLDKAILDAVQKMSAFNETTSENSTEGLAGTINQLARGIPEVFGGTAAEKPSAKQLKPEAAPAKSSGLIGQAAAAYGYMQTLRQIDQLANETGRVRETADELRKPIRAMMAATIQRGREWGNPGASNGATGASAGESAGNGAHTPSTREEFDALTAKFKTLSGVMLPLNEEIVILDQSRANLLEWRSSIATESKSVVRALLLHVVTIAVALGLLLVFSEVWRRFTFRYVHDVRRRRQFLILRRFVIGFLMSVIIILGFVSEFGSLATFAGFATAGIAVALQAVLLSVAAYFFLIGRFGVRVGDRISVSGVTGDVIDIGLVRLYLMELAGNGVDLHPTGRVAVFSNSVLFQPTTPLYKQIPGTEFAWHEVAIPLAPGGNYKLVQDKVMAAVSSIFAKYRTTIEKQYGNIERRIDIQLKAPSPEAKLRLLDSGMELEVRYPVEIRTASEIDDQVTMSVLEAIQANEELRAGISGSPRIRTAVKT
jgi:small-conductance mechanosensitive channel